MEKIFKYKTKQRARILEYLKRLDFKEWSNLFKTYFIASFKSL